MVSARSALDFLKRLHDPDLEMSQPGKAVIVAETEGLSGLGRVNAHLLAQVQKHHPVDVATLDLDASIHPCNKREALVAYEHGRAYQPVIVVWSEQKLAVHDQFRDGNVPAGMGNVGVLEAALKPLPQGISKKCVRGDKVVGDLIKIPGPFRGRGQWRPAEAEPAVRVARDNDRVCLASG
jgi:hypothetical protein